MKGYRVFIQNNENWIQIKRVVAVCGGAVVQSETLKFDAILRKWITVNRLRLIWLYRDVSVAEMALTISNIASCRRVRINK